MNKIFMAILVPVLISCSWDEKADKTRDAANKIILGLETHKKDMGFYPELLIHLSPRYLDKVPTTFYADENNEFHYRRLKSSNDSTKATLYYELWYFAPLGVEVKYNSLNKEWEHDD